MRQSREEGKYYASRIPLPALLRRKVMVRQPLLKPLRNAHMILSDTRSVSHTQGPDVNLLRHLNKPGADEPGEFLA
jgi:hypothetical protein